MVPGTLTRHPRSQAKAERVGPSTDRQLRGCVCGEDCPQLPSRGGYAAASPAVSWQLASLANPATTPARTQADIRRQVIGFMPLTEAPPEWRPGARGLDVLGVVNGVRMPKRWCRARGQEDGSSMAVTKAAILRGPGPSMPCPSPRQQATARGDMAAKSGCIPMCERVCLRCGQKAGWEDRLSAGGARPGTPSSAPVPASLIRRPGAEDEVPRGRSLGQKAEAEVKSESARPVSTGAVMIDVQNLRRPRVHTSDGRAAVGQPRER